MKDPTQAILNVNRRFYHALAVADYPAMCRIWLASPDAVCVHPGQPALNGWDAIRSSWRAILAQQGPLHVWPSEVEVRLFGQTAEVHCLENVETGEAGGIIQARAVNIYRAAGRGWKLLEHHVRAFEGGAPQPVAPFSHN